MKISAFGLLVLGLQQLRCEADVTPVTDMVHVGNGLCRDENGRRLFEFWGDMQPDEDSCKNWCYSQVGNELRGMNYSSHHECGCVVDQDFRNYNRIQLNPGSYSSNVGPGAVAAVLSCCGGTYECYAYQPVWSLALNINPSDGNNAGWGSSLWKGTSNVGTDQDSLINDFKKVSVWGESFNCLAIARHDGTSMSGVKVWRMADSRSLNEHFTSVTTPSDMRTVVTVGGPVQNTIAPEAQNIDIDPILASSGEDNNLAFNWQYGNNGARVVLTDVGHHSGALSDTNTNDDDCHGLGNELGANTSNGNGSTRWYHDASVIQDDCSGASCQVQGTDHGSQLTDAVDKLGNYAFYIAESASNECPQFTVLPMLGTTTERVAVEDVTGPPPAYNKCAGHNTVAKSCGSTWSAATPYCCPGLVCKESGYKCVRP